MTNVITDLLNETSSSISTHTLYPNPAKGVLKLHLPSAVNSDLFFQIFDVTEREQLRTLWKLDIKVTM